MTRQELAIRADGVALDSPGFRLIVELMGGLKDRLDEEFVPGAEFTGWIHLPAEIEAALPRITSMAEEIRNESDSLVVVGIGGSYLGTRAAYEALGSGEGGVELHWAGCSLSPVMTRRLLDTLDGRDYTINVVSKSGGTMEPALAFRLLAEHARARYGASWTDRVVVTTDPAKGALRRWVRDAGIIRTLEIPPSVGGRFSVLTPVGLLPLAAAGIDVTALVSGARDLQRAMESMPPDQNPAVQYAAVRCALEQRGRVVEVLTLPGPELNQFGEWWRQLAGESEGKDGGGIWPSLLTLTTDLHSVGQYLQDGRRMIQETFLALTEHDDEPCVPSASPVADGLDLVAGHPLGLVNRMALEGTREAHRAGDVPGVTITAPRLNPYCLGQLFYFFEVAVALTALFHGVNPFDQPGVETYKKSVKARLESLA